MAEGGLPISESGRGSPHLESSADSRSDHQFDAHLLECPICLEQLRQPKSLPCLHSFCQECLATFIVKDLSEQTTSVTSFPCPVCRTTTQPLRPSDSNDTWVQQFPTNNLINGLIILKQKSVGPLYCKFCKKAKSLEIPATIWCKLTNSLFCDSCKVSYHDIIHEECDPLDVTGNVMPVQESSKGKCSFHKKKLAYYCEEHQIVGCSKCMILDHRGCEVVTAEAHCQQLDFTTIDSSLGNATDAVELLVKDLDEQVEVMLQDQDTGLGSITEHRQRLDAYLDKRQKEVTDQLVAAHKEEKAKVNKTIQKCDRLKIGINNTRESLETARTRKEYPETIWLYQRGQAELQSYRDLVKEMKNTSSMVRVSHEVDSNHGNISKDSTLAFGSVRVEKLPRVLRDVTGTLGTPPLLECQVKEISKIYIKSKSDSYCTPHGVVYMQEDIIVVSDYRKDKLKLCTNKGKLLDELKIMGYTHEVCIMDNNTVAVAVSSQNMGIHLVKIEAFKLSLSSMISLPGNKPCHGITYTGDNFIVTTPKEVYSVTREGKATKLHDLSVECLHLAYDIRQRQTIVGHNTSENGQVAVSIMSASRQTDLLAVGVVKGAMGVDVDREGNVYVCGRDSNNVVQISADGKHVRELLTSEHGVELPRAISVCWDQFVVTNTASGKSDYIHLYQLY